MNDAIFAATVDDPTVTTMSAITQIEIPWLKFSSINPLVSAAMPLILLISRIKAMPQPTQILEFHRQVIREIAAFEEQAKKQGCTPRLILAARYCLCTALDEVVLCTSWGSQSLWTQQTLLSLIHKETWGGERFFLILEKMAEEGKQNKDLLDLIYILLSLGYEGKYYNQDSMVREEIRYRLFRITQAYHGQINRHLSPTKPEIKSAGEPNVRRTPAWIIGLFTLIVFSTLWFGFNLKTYYFAKNTIEELDSLAPENPKLIFQDLQNIGKAPAKRK